MAPTACHKVNLSSTCVTAVPHSNVAGRNVAMCSHRPLPSQAWSFDCTSDLELMLQPDSLTALSITRMPSRTSWQLCTIILIILMLCNAAAAASVHNISVCSRRLGYFFIVGLLWRGLSFQ